MKVTLIFDALLISLCLINSEAYIAVNIDPEDLDRVSEFFHTIIINQQHEPQLSVPMKFKILSMLKNGIFASFQLMGVVIALVGANVITTHLTTDSVQQQQQQQQQLSESIQIRNPVVQKQPIQSIQNDSSIFKNAEMCNMRDYGCNRNLCWRTCNVNVGKNHSLWCYTSSNPLARVHHYCVDSKDCSLCWECIEKCHT